MRENIYTVIGVNTKSNEVIMLTSLFNHNDGFKGATGAVYGIVTAEQVAEYNTVDYTVERLEGTDILTSDEDIRSMLEDEFECNNSRMDYESKVNMDDYTDEDADEFDQEGYDNAVDQLFFDAKTEYVDNEFSAKQTECHNDIAQDYIMNCDGEYPFHDNSYIYKISDDTHETIKTHLGEYETLECIGGGRCFNKDMFKSADYVWFDMELVNEIKIYEYF